VKSGGLLHGRLAGAGVSVVVLAVDSAFATGSGVVWMDSHAGRSRSNQVLKEPSRAKGRENGFMMLDYVTV